MMEDEKQSVVISLERFEELIESENDLAILLCALWENCSLSWNKQYLQINGENVSQFLKVMWRRNYDQKMKELIDAESKEGE